MGKYKYGKPLFDWVSKPKPIHHIMHVARVMSESRQWREDLLAWVVLTLTHTSNECPKSSIGGSASQSSHYGLVWHLQKFVVASVHGSCHKSLRRTTPHTTSQMHCQVIFCLLKFSVSYLKESLEGLVDSYIHLETHWRNEKCIQQWSYGSRPPPA